MSNKEKAWKEKLKTDVEFAFANKKNHTPHAYIDIAGGLVEGTLLTQILYWCGNDKSEHGKLTIFKDGHYWLAKGRDDWYEEVRITPRQYDTAISKLKGEVKEKGKVVKIDETRKLVEVKVFKFKGTPTTHIRPMYENINRAIEEWKKNLTHSIDRDIEQEKQFDVNSNSQNGDFVKLQNCEKEITDMQDDIYNNIYINNNTEITDKDYSTENTIKYALKDKSFKDTGIYASFPEEKEEHTQKQNRYIPPDYTAEQLREHIAQPIYNRMKSVYGEMTDDEMSEELIDIIVEFYKEYAKHFGKRHRVLSDKAYENIVDRYMNPPVVMEDCYSVEIYSDMMKRYFEVNYNQRGKYDGDITLGLSHFMDDTIRENLYYQTCY